MKIKGWDGMEWDALMMLGLAFFAAATYSNYSDKHLGTNIRQPHQVQVGKAK